MWIERVLGRLGGAREPVLLEGGDAWGAPYVIDALQRRVRVAWVDIEPSDENDYVAQGNAVADAINRAVGARLLPKALPYATNLQLFLQQRDLVEPLTIVVADAGWAPRLAASLVALHDERTKVVLSAADGARLRFLSDVRRIGPAELALTLAEAHELLGSQLPAGEVEPLWRDARGSYPEFMGRGGRRLGRPAVALPRPEGAVVAAPDALLAEPDEVIDALLRAEDWLHAVELAAQCRPERLPALLPRGGASYQRLGLLRRLHLLLESLEPERQQHEEVLAWRYLAAFAAGRSEAIRPLVEAWLERFEAPELRARHAGVLADPGRALAEAERALRSRETPLTLFQVGRLHHDPETGIRMLVRSVDLAEAEDVGYDLVRNAGALAERLAHAGRFREAATWGEWSLREYDKRDIQDGQRRLRLLNNWAYASILTGRSLGLEEPLRDLRVALEGTMPTLAASFRSTLAALALSRGDVAEAARLARTNLDQVRRRQQARFALELVRILVELGDLPAALREGRAAAELTQRDGAYFRGMGQVAHGVALALQRPEEAAALLREAMGLTELPAETRCMAALYWMVATDAAPAALPEEVRALFGDLTEAGLRALSGPETAFHAVWGRILGAETRLELRFFGTAEARLDGAPVRLTRAGAEILLLLSEHPQGLSEEQLHARLFEDGPGVESVTLRVRVSRLRERVPVTDSPYRLALAYDSDLARLRRRLDEGDVQAAVELYRGALLPGSEADGVRAMRSEVEELLRQATLASGHVEVLLTLAATLSDDLTLWEAALDLIPRQDPRALYVRAQVLRLQRDYTT